jgi:hypothetical protein
VNLVGGMHFNSRIDVNHREDNCIVGFLDVPLYLLARRRWRSGGGDNDRTAGREVPSPVKWAARVKFGMLGQVHSVPDNKLRNM